MMNPRLVLTLSAAQLLLTSGQQDPELKTSCLLQTGVASTEPLDMYSNEADDGSHAEYLRNALVMVRGLASNVTAWDTNLSQSERTSLDLIKAFIADLFTSAVNSHDEDQKEVNRAKDLIAWCASTASASLTNDVGPLKSIMEGARQDHNGCRTSEGGCQVKENQHCAAWEAYRKSNTPNNCVSVDFKDQMGTTVESTKLDMEQCLRDLRPYYLKHIPCWQNKECVDGFAPLCDKNQTKFEGDYCSYSSQLRHTCEAQIDCRTKHIANRNDTHADVRVNEAARKADYSTGKNILCYFRVFEANNPNKSAVLRDCDKLAVDTSKLVITYPGIPDPNPCVIEPNKPCDNDWVSTEYDAKPWKNHVTMQDCEPCLTPTSPPKVSTCYGVSDQSVNQYVNLAVNGVSVQAWCDFTTDPGRVWRVGVFPYDGTHVWSSADNLRNFCAANNFADAGKGVAEHVESWLVQKRMLWDTSSPSTTQTQNGPSLAMPIFGSPPYSIYTGTNSVLANLPANKGQDHCGSVGEHLCGKWFGSSTGWSGDWYVNDFSYPDPEDWGSHYATSTIPIGEQYISCMFLE
jgi:hypothetical protein